MLKPRHILFIIFIVCALATNSTAQTGAQRVRLAVLDFGGSETGRSVASKLALLLSSNNDFSLIDRDESLVAARGAGYTGSLNMTLQEARDLGAAIGADFYITGDAQTLRRSSSTEPVYYEAYASIFIVSARTGRLIMWDRPSFERGKPEEAERALQAELGQRAAVRYIASINAFAESEREARAISTAHGVPLIEEVPMEDSPAARGLRPPAPYRRLRPAYPETAARAEAEGTVDVLVDIDADGEVASVEVVRWAGFGLDEECVNTIRRMHFRPAMRDGQAVPMRALLRYNF